MPDGQQPQRPEEAAALAAAKGAGQQVQIQPAKLEFTAFEGLFVERDNEQNVRIVALSALPKIIVVLAFPQSIAAELGKQMTAPSVQLPGGMPPASNGQAPT